jgi:hypothetical protein
MRWWEKSSLDQGQLNLDFVDEATALKALSTQLKSKANPRFSPSVSSDDSFL